MTEDSSNKTLAILTHILGLFTGFLGPLIILLVSKEEHTKKHAKHALNWQVSLIVYGIISLFLMFVLVGFLFLLALVIVDIIFCVKATIKASRNETWKYPLAIPFVKA